MANNILGSPNGGMNGGNNNNSQNQQQGQRRRRPNPNGGGLPNPNIVGLNGAAQNNNNNTNNMQNTSQPTPNNSTPTTQTVLNNSQTQSPKKKGCLIAVIAGVVILVGGVIILSKNVKAKEPVVTEPEVYMITTDYESTGRYALDKYLSVIKNYDNVGLLAENENSWLAEEWDYANAIELRENWIRSVCAYVDFSYPKVKALNNLGEVYLDENGQPVAEESDLLNGEPVTVTYIDYNYLAETMKEEIQIIWDMYEESGYSPVDFNYKDEMINLMLDYLLDKATYQTKTTEMTFEFEEREEVTYDEDGFMSSAYRYYVTDDTELDKLLFSSDEFHNMLDEFGKLINEYEYTKEQNAVKSQKEEYDAAVKVAEEKLKELQDKALSKGATEEEIALIEVPEKYKVEEWVEPETYVTKEYTKENIIPYTWCGAYFAQNEYKGTSNKNAQVGDGTFDYPAGIGTSIITKAMDTEGVFHDVKVTLEAFYTGQEAVDYAISFSEKNRGFDVSSAVQLICFEIRIDNLEAEPFTLNSDLFLADAHGNQSAKTGTMHGFYSRMTVEDDNYIILNDWATSTDLEQKFVCWGKSFNRQFPVVWFRLLAGSGEEIESYSATNSYLNKDGSPSDSGKGSHSNAKDNFVNQSGDIEEPEVTSVTDENGVLTDIDTTDSNINTEEFDEEDDEEDTDSDTNSDDSDDE